MRNSTAEAFTCRRSMGSSVVHNLVSRPCLSWHAARVERVENREREREKEKDQAGDKQICDGVQGVHIRREGPWILGGREKDRTA